MTPRNIVGIDIRNGLVSTIEVVVVVAHAVHSTTPSVDCNPLVRLSEKIPKYRHEQKRSNKDSSERSIREFN